MLAVDHRYEEERTLRVVSPQLYEMLLEELEKSNIHSFDVDARAIQDESGLHVSLRYGENFAHKQTLYVSFQAIKEDNSHIRERFHQVGKDCQETIIADYFKMMKP